MPIFRSASKTSFESEHPFSNLPLIIASGLGRSGTTVLRHCLAGHQRVASFNNECNYIHDLMRAASVHNDKGNFRKSLPVGVENYWQMHRQVLLNMFWPIGDWANPQRFAAISTYSMLDPRAALGLDKTFPKLAICYIVRNGIEVVSSYISFPAFAHLSFQEVCKLWALRNDMFQFQATRDHVFLFRHEWLLSEVEKFEQQFTAALNSIGLEFDSNCLSPLTKKFHPTRFEGESRLASKDRKQRKERWKLWTDDQRETFVTICGEAMNQQGYAIPWT